MNATPTLDKIAEVSTPVFFVLALFTGIGVLEQLIMRYIGIVGLLFAMAGVEIVLWRMYR